MNEGDESQAEFDRRVISFIGGDASETACQSLGDYLSNYTGAWFHTTADRDENRITANDLVAVTMLGVDVPPRAAHWILTDGSDEIARLLRSIQPASLEIWDAAADLWRESAAWKLWDLIEARPGIGPTISSKVLAAKRPHLFPIYDTVVGAALGIRNATYWTLWQNLLRDDRGAAVHEAVRKIKREVRGSEPFSTLRVIDIVVWMQSRHHE